VAENLIQSKRMETGSLISSPHIDVSRFFEISYKVVVRSTSQENSQLQVRLEHRLDGIWRAIQTDFVSGDTNSIWYHHVGNLTLVRFVLVCLSGECFVSLSLVDRPVSDEPENFVLDPFGIVHVDEDQKVSELAPPQGANLYLGTNAAGDFGYHPLPTGSGSVQISWNEIPIGDIDGVNRTFTFQHAPNPISSATLSLNGIILTQGVDFVLAGETITYHPDQTPEVGDIHKVTYQHA